MSPKQKVLYNSEDGIKLLSFIQSTQILSVTYTFEGEGYDAKYFESLFESLGLPKHGKDQRLIKEDQVELVLTAFKLYKENDWTVRSPSEIGDDESKDEPAYDHKMYNEIDILMMSILLEVYSEDDVIDMMKMGDLLSEENNKRLSIYFRSRFPGLKTGHLIYFSKNSKYGGNNFGTYVYNGVEFDYLDDDYMDISVIPSYLKAIEKFPIDYWKDVLDGDSKDIVWLPNDLPPNFDVTYYPRFVKSMSTLTKEGRVEDIFLPNINYIECHDVDDTNIGYFVIDDNVNDVKYFLYILLDFDIIQASTEECYTHVFSYSDFNFDITHCELMDDNSLSFSLDHLSIPSYFRPDLTLNYRNGSGNEEEKEEEGKVEGKGEGKENVDLELPKLPDTFGNLPSLPQGVVDLMPNPPP